MTDKIKNRESWLKVGVISITTIVLAFKFWWMPFSVNLPDFRMVDLVSVILAIFAISLSVAFYFKATDTSNTFYDNTYKFTKDISEILGRIEAGFGERLKHLDEGYSGLRDRVEHFAIDPKGAEEKVHQEEKEVENKEHERNRLIEELAIKAKLQQDEKDKLFQELAKRDNELIEAKQQLSFMQERLSRADTPDSPAEFNNIRDLIPGASYPFLHYMKKRLVHELGRDTIINAPAVIIRQRFQSIKNDLPVQFLTDLRKNDLLDSNNELSRKAIAVLRRMVGA